MAGPPLQCTGCYALYRVGRGRVGERVGGEGGEWEGGGGIALPSGVTCQSHA